MYYIYHIPGIKIGVTNNLDDRVTVQQGYDQTEYEILETSYSIDYISKREQQLQKEYGYKVDRDYYKHVVNKNKKSNKMKINPTVQTTTFPYPLSKLKGHLYDNIGMKWETPQGYQFEITEENIQWIIHNAKESMYNHQRCFIYNKAFYEEFFSEKPKTKPSYNENRRFELIRDWAVERGIYHKGDSHTQYIKLMEEAGELAQALLKNDKAEVIDAIGDIVVVLTNLARLKNLNIEDCIDSAYNEIANRKGEMINGTFVKETL